MTFLRLLLGFSLVSVCAPLIAGLLGIVHPVFDSFSHFRLHLLVPLIAGTIFAAWLDMKWIARTGVGVILICMAATLPFLPGLDRLTRKPANGGQLTIMQLNILYNNPNLQQAISALSSEQSDFVLLQEITATTQPALDALKPAYPFQLSCSFQSVGSVAIASRHPFVETAKKKCIRAYGLASARFSVAGREVTLASYHSYWPWPFSQFDQIYRLEDHFKKMEAPIILAGDFNATPWSHAVKTVATMTNTKPAAGLSITWTPSFADWRGPKWMGLPIDQTLYSKELALKSRTVGPDAGSDHLPVISQFQWIEPDQMRSANASNNLLFRIFPVEEAGNVSAMIMRPGLL